MSTAMTPGKSRRNIRYVSWEGTVAALDSIRFTLDPIMVDTIVSAWTEKHKHKLNPSLRIKKTIFLDNTNLILIWVRNTIISY